MNFCFVVVDVAEGTCSLQGSHIKAPTLITQSNYFNGSIAILQKII